MSDLAALLAGLDAGERVRGRGFERLCRWVLENAPEYAAKVEQVWLRDEWPGRQGRRLAESRRPRRRRLVLANPFVQRAGRDPVGPQAPMTI